MERLGESGCDDALAGIGQPSRLALEFTRKAKQRRGCCTWRAADVKHAIPAARLIEMAPDFVGLTDTRGSWACRARIMRKLMLTHSGNFPAPVHEGSASIWHLAEVLAWLEAKRGYVLERDMLEVAKVVLQVNLARDEESAFDKGLSEAECTGQLSGRIGIATDQLVNRVRGIAGVGSSSDCFDNRI